MTLDTAAAQAASPGAGDGPDTDDEEAVRVVLHLPASLILRLEMQRALERLGKSEMAAKVLKAGLLTENQIAAETAARGRRNGSR